MNMRVILVVGLFFILTSTEAQNNIGNVGVDLGKNGYIDNFFSRKKAGTNFDEIAGSAFLNKEFRPGQIMLKSGQVFSDVMIRFNAYQNEVVARKNGVSYAIDTAKEVTYNDIEGDPASKVVIRSGYPAVGNLTNGSYYTLLAGGKQVHLLKYVQRKIQERNIPGYDNVKEFVNFSDMYIFSEKDGMQKIKTGKKQVETALPSYKQAIALAITKFSLNLSKEEDIAILVNELDGQ